MNQGFSGKGIEEASSNLCNTSILDDFYLAKNGKVIRCGKKCQFSVIISSYMEVQQRTNISQAIDLTPFVVTENIEHIHGK